MANNLFNQYYPINGSSAFNSYHLLDNSNLNKFYNLLSSKGFINKIASIFVKPSDSLTSIRAYPIVKSKLEGYTYSLDYINFAGYYWNTSGNPKGREFYYFTKSFLIGSYTFPAANSFIDFEPYTSVELYLPFMGFIDLPVNELIGNKMEIEYAFDFSTGICNAYINIISTKKYTIATKSAKLGVDVPWNYTNSADNLKNILTTIASTAISIYSVGASKMGDAAKAITKHALVSKAAVSVVNSLQVRYERGGLCSGYGNSSAQFHPYLIIKKPKLVNVNEADYAHIYGKPLFETKIISQMRGFTVISDVHISNIPDAYVEELDEIETLLKQGVHL